VGKADIAHRAAGVIGRGLCVVIDLATNAVAGAGRDLLRRADRVAGEAVHGPLRQFLWRSYLVALGGEAEVARTSEIGRFRPEADIRPSTSSKGRVLKRSLKTNLSTEDLNGD
jgi:hypothetical protein